MKIKVANLNVWDGGRLFEDIIRWLNQEDPDITFFQEVTNLEKPELTNQQHQCFQALQTHTNLKYGDFATAADLLWEDETKTPYGNAILAKTPIKSCQTIFYDIPRKMIRKDRGPTQFPLDPRCLQHCTAEFNSETIHLFNTQGIWGLDGGDSTTRLNMSAKIVKQIKDKDPVILAGDFNVKPNTKTIGNIEKQLSNVFKNKLTSTFNMKRKSNPGYATAVVDMIFVSPTIKVLDHYCLQVDISDHLPLVAELEI
ncbi:endonuclease/exonuclease/phosphatase family protein [Candidatus Beckwithbacteria bacterium]|nr:endonuclease/exonuclease/phosphatase family protein [Candidatus Beckwithbacteria bacterium]